MNATGSEYQDQISQDRFNARKYVFRRIGFDSNGCWPWLGVRVKTRRDDGRLFLPYGEAYWGRSEYGCWKAHRLSWFAFHGPIPDGMMVLHKCDNPPCCNPNHLFLGTALENVRDCSSKGRAALGVKHPKSILTDDTVRSIRGSYIPKIVTMRMLSDKYNVAIGLISDVITRKRWNHVT